MVVLVPLHEFGHLVVAKSCGVGVLCYSVGFGPKLVSFQIGETEYALSAIPLGGYNRFIDEKDRAKLTDQEVEELKAKAPQRLAMMEDSNRWITKTPPFQHFLISSAGVALNLLFAWFAYWFVREL